MKLVLTTQGPIERDRLTVRDVVTEDDKSRIVATEYYLDGGLVRRSVWVDLWMPMETRSNG